MVVGRGRRSRLGFGWKSSKRVGVGEGVGVKGASLVGLGLRSAGGFGAVALEVG